VAFAGTTSGGVLALSLGAVSVASDPADHTGETVSVAVDLTAPVAAHHVFSGAVRGTVVAAGTGAYLVDFPDAPLVVDLPDGRVLVVSVNDLAVAPGLDATLTGQVVQPPSNRPPVADDDTYTRHRGNHPPVVTTGVLANDTDPEGDALTAELVSGPSRGSIVFRPDGTFSYAPAPNESASTPPLVVPAKATPPALPATSVDGAPGTGVATTAPAGGTAAPVVIVPPSAIVAPGVNATSCTVTATAVPSASVAARGASSKSNTTPPAPASVTAPCSTAGTDTDTAPIRTRRSNISPS
jgi:hypothetical protein